MNTMHEVLKKRVQDWVAPTDTVRKAVDYICTRKAGAVVVKGDDEIVGIFSERDLMHRVVNKGLNPEEVPVSEVMSLKLVHVHIADDLRLARALMVMNGVRHLVVVGDEHEFRGLLSMRDIFRTEDTELSSLFQKLNDQYYEQSYKTEWRVSSNRVIVKPYESKDRAAF